MLIPCHGLSRQVLRRELARERELREQFQCMAREHAAALADETASREQLLAELTASREQAQQAARQASELQAALEAGGSRRGGG